MNLLSFLKLLPVMSLALLCSLSLQAEESAEPAFSMGNGTENWIDVETCAHYLGWLARS